MKIGAQYQGDGSGTKVFARRAEATGFDSVWTGDHVGHIVDGLAALGILAGGTEEITIGVNVIVVPYRPAPVIAKALATVALVAPGRVVAGFGVGGEFPGEFTATGADLRARGAYTDEALEVVTRLWTGEPIDFAGQFTTLERFCLEPAPQEPPTVWVGGRSDAAMRRALRFGQGYVPYLVSPEQLAARKGRLTELAAELPSAPDLTLGCLCTFLPGPSVDEAVDLALRSLKLSGMSPKTVRTRYLLGDDDAVVARAQEYVNAGAEHLILGSLPGPVSLEDEFFAAADRLLPTLRALLPQR